MSPNDFDDCAVPSEMPGFVIDGREEFPAASARLVGHREGESASLSITLVPATAEQARHIVDGSQTLQGLSHEHVVSLQEAVALDNAVAFVSQRFGQGTLSRLLQARPVLTPQEVVTVVVPAAMALGHLHQQGLRHGAVDADHIVLARDGKPLLLDSGVKDLVASTPDSKAHSLEPAALREDVHQLVDLGLSALGPVAEQESAETAGLRKVLDKFKALPVADADPMALAVEVYEALAPHPLDMIDSDAPVVPIAAEEKSVSTAVKDKAPVAPAAAADEATAKKDSVPAKTEQTSSTSQNKDETKPAAGTAAKTAAAVAAVGALTGAAALKGEKGESVAPSPNGVKPEGDKDAKAGAADQPKSQAKAEPKDAVAKQDGKAKKADTEKSEAKKDAQATTAPALKVVESADKDVLPAAATAEPKNGRGLWKAIAAALVLIIIIGGAWIWEAQRRSSSQEAVAPKLKPVPAAVKGDDPAAALQGLADMRAEAFAFASKDAMARVNIAGSPAAEADATIIDSLLKQNERLFGYTSHVKEPKVVSRQGDQAVVTAKVETGSHSRVKANGDLIAKVAEVPARPTRLVLQRLDGQWKISKIG